MEIGAEKLTLIDSDISSKQIEIKANKLIFDGATINTDVISINSPSIEGKLLINNNGLFLNGVEVDKNEDIIDTYDLNLRQKRLELVNSLKKIERISEETIAEQLKKQPVKRVLKK